MTTNQYSCIFMPEFCFLRAIDIVDFRAEVITRAYIFFDIYVKLLLK